MRLSEEFKTITEQLNELYQYKRFLEERISILEFKLQEVGEMMDFVDTLNEKARQANQDVKNQDE
ncbi:MAG: hypothetical protein SFU25_08540 [Candidatus Caenarcaniphilales bacterium]|nr:hypothetical protein [Candidatus Caenarcaniphilales bacterium]